MNINFNMDINHLVEKYFKDVEIKSVGLDENADGGTFPAFLDIAIPKRFFLEYLRLKKLNDKFENNDLGDLLYGDEFLIETGLVSKLMHSDKIPIYTSPTSSRNEALEFLEYAEKNISVQNEKSMASYINQDQMYLRVCEILPEDLDEP